MTTAQPPTFPGGCVGNGVTHTFGSKLYSQCALTIDSDVNKFLALEPMPNGLWLVMEIRRVQLCTGTGREREFLTHPS